MESYGAAARYATRVLQRVAGIEDIPLRYGGTEEPKGDALQDEVAIHFVPSGFFAHEYGTRASLPCLPLLELDGVPILFGRPLVRRKGNALVVYADLIASTYFLVTRYEEWIRKEVRDEHSRFPGTESLPYRGGFIDRPVVDEYGALIRKWCGELGMRNGEPRRKFSVLLTHDVDRIHVRRGPVQALRSLASGMLRYRPVGAAVHAAGASLQLAADPLDNIDQVIALDRLAHDGRSDAACRSIYFFMSGGKSRFDGHYNIRSATAKRWMEAVKTSGAEIGIHASYEAGDRPELIAEERRILEEASGRQITINRHHFLRWREPHHGVAIANAGIIWDSTLGYADVAGFRLGTCQPTPLFCPVHMRELGIEEHPLVVMDQTLSKYMSLSEEEAFERVRRLIDVTHRYCGEFVALWHNSTLATIDPSYPYHLRLYRRLMKYIRSKLVSSGRRPADVREC